MLVRRRGLSGLLQTSEVYVGRLLVPWVDTSVAVGEFWKPWGYVDWTQSVHSPFLAIPSVDMEVANNAVKLLEQGPSAPKS